MAELSPPTKLPRVGIVWLIGFGILAIWCLTSRMSSLLEPHLDGQSPTKFAGVFMMDNLTQSIETSPMLAPLPYAETVAVFERLQQQFGVKGWVPTKEGYDHK